MAQDELPTFAFTDIVGSTALKSKASGSTNVERDRHFATTILKPHRSIIEADLINFDGQLVSTQGDGHFLVFSSPMMAVLWAISVQDRHEETPISTPDGQSLGIKIGLHMGKAAPDPTNPKNFIGRSVDLTARITDYAQRGQILASSAVSSVVQAEEIFGVSFHNHGFRELSGIGPREIFEILHGDKQPGSLKGDKPRPATDASASQTPLLGSSGSQPTGTGGNTATAVAGVGAGTVVGNYDLLRKIGAGGMGSVYLARHRPMDRQCVVKIIKDEPFKTADAKTVDRFYREVKIVAKLKHPNVVEAYDASNPTDSLHYLVMEYIAGVSLDQLVRLRGPLPVAAACEVIRQAAIGLQYVHENGLIHRDIKPSNLMVTADGATTRVKILDLGIALLADDSEERLTGQGQAAVGTAYYMAPEQWQLSTLDIRADIYSLGCTFYHLLSGRPPFKGSEFTQEYAHLNVAAPPPETVDPLPREVEAILAAMLEKSPDSRFATPGEVALELETFADAAQLTTLASGLTPSSETATGTAETPRPSATKRGASSGGGFSSAQQRLKKKSRKGWLRRAGIAALAMGIVAVAAYALFRRPISDDTARARTVVASMPGLNGRWWYEETPWFVPSVRAKFIEEVNQGVNQFGELNLRTLADEINNGEVKSSYDHLAKIARDLRSRLPEREQKWLERLEQCQNQGADQRKGEIKKLLNDMKKEGPLTETELHLRAILENDVGNTDEAQQSFEDALKLYAKSGNQTLRGLCQFDYGWMLYRQQKSDAAIKEFSAIGRMDKAESTAPALRVSALCAEALANRKRAISGACPDCLEVALHSLKRADEVKGLATQHPLRIHTLDCKAWTQLDFGQFDNARASFQESTNAWDDKRDDQKLTARLRWMWSSQGQALTEYHLGNWAQAAEGFKNLIKRIERYDTERKPRNPYLDLGIYRRKLKEARPNTLELLADCDLYFDGQSKEAASLRLKRAKDNLEQAKDDSEKLGNQYDLLKSNWLVQEYKWCLARILMARVESEPGRRLKEIKEVDEEIKKVDTAVAEHEGAHHHTPPGERPSQGENPRPDFPRVKTLVHSLLDIEKSGADGAGRNQGLSKLAESCKDASSKPLARIEIAPALLAFEIQFQELPVEQPETQATYITLARQLDSMTKDYSSQKLLSRKLYLQHCFIVAHDAIGKSLKNHEDKDLRRELKKIDELLADSAP